MGGGNGGNGYGYGYGGNGVMVQGRTKETFFTSFRTLVRNVPY